jgi:hypothetical protein
MAYSLPSDPHATLKHTGSDALQALSSRSRVSWAHWREAAQLRPRDQTSEAGHRQAAAHDSSGDQELYLRRLRCRCALLSLLEARPKSPAAPIVKTARTGPLLRLARRLGKCQGRCSHRSPFGDARRAHLRADKGPIRDGRRSDRGRGRGYTRSANLQIIVVATELEQVPASGGPYPVIGRPVS